VALSELSIGAGEGAFFLAVFLGVVFLAFGSTGAVTSSVLASSMKVGFVAEVSGIGSALPFSILKYCAQDLQFVESARDDSS